METIELEPGWLELQMEKVKKEVEAWPEEVKQLRHRSEERRVGKECW